MNITLGRQSNSINVCVLPCYLVSRPWFGLNLSAYKSDVWWLRIHRRNWGFFASRQQTGVSSRSAVTRYSKLCHRT